MVQLLQLELLTISWFRVPQWLLLRSARTKCSSVVVNTSDNCKKPMHSRFLMGLHNHFTRTVAVKILLLEKIRILNRSESKVHPARHEQVTGSQKKRLEASLLTHGDSETCSPRLCICWSVVWLLFGLCINSKSDLRKPVSLLAVTRFERTRLASSPHSPSATSRSGRSLLYSIFYVLDVYFQLIANCACAERAPTLPGSSPRVLYTSNVFYRGLQWKERAASGISVSEQAAYEA